MGSCMSFPIITESNSSDTNNNEDINSGNSLLNSNDSNNQNNHQNNQNNHKPIFGEKWVSYPQISKDHLIKRREIFWETQIEGRQECWQTLKQAIDSWHTDEIHGYSTALMILETFGMKPVQGKLDSVYGDKGHLYLLPTYVVVDPDNLLMGDEENFKELNDKVDMRAISGGEQVPSTPL